MALQQQTSLLSTGLQYNNTQVDKVRRRQFLQCGVRQEKGNNS